MEHNTKILATLIVIPGSKIAEEKALYSNFVFSKIIQIVLEYDKR
jgi:hypothetical protein